jgi:hypothetical protein
MSEPSTYNALAWDAWRADIVRLLRGDLRGELHGVTMDDIDWLAWQPYYTQGKSPRQAIERALERDL